LLDGQTNTKLLLVPTQNSPNKPLINTPHNRSQSYIAG